MLRPLQRQKHPHRNKVSDGALLGFGDGAAGDARGTACGTTFRGVDYQGGAPVAKDLSLIHI